MLEGLQNRQVSAYPPLGGINYNPSVVGAYQRGLDCTYGWIYKTQPAVRSVVDLIATNTAQLPLKLYERVSDTERERREDHPAAELLADPDGHTPSDAFIRRIFLDYLIWDNAYVLKLRGANGQRVLFRLLPQYVSVYGGRYTPDGYVIWAPDGQGYEVPASDMLHWFGYDPEDPLRGLSKLETLRLELAQDRAVQETLVQLAKQGLKGGYIRRPLEAPEADQDDVDRIAEQWKAAKLKGDPILDEGMEYIPIGITPKEAEVIASRQFSKQEVADAYGLPMKALMEGDTDARKLLYADVLPPFTKSFACQLDVDILRAEFDEADFYFEFDLNEKLRGDLEGRFQAMTAAAGGPWITRNEVRAKENLPPVKHGDDLIIPLNVMEEGPDSPRLPAGNVMPPQDPNKPPQDGSYREEPTKAINGRANLKIAPAAQIATILIRLYQRQESSLRTNGTLEVQRFTRELGNDLATIPGADRELAHAKALDLVKALELMLKSLPATDVFARARESAPEMATLIAGSLGVDVEAMKALEVPREVIWRRAGFSPEQVDQMRSMQYAEGLLDAGESSLTSDNG